jgi:hypothetical protein
MVQWQHHMATSNRGQAGCQILRHLVEKAGEWSLFNPLIAPHGYKTYLYDSLSELLKLETFTSGRFDHCLATSEITDLIGGSAGRRR